MRITKRVREEAGRICSQMACLRAARDSYQSAGPIAIRLGACTAEERVAWLAFEATETGVNDLPDHWAEAEALLRCGWTP
jgi:hypothetical protein